MLTFCTTVSDETLAHVANTRIPGAEHKLGGGAHFK